MNFFYMLFAPVYVVLGRCVRKQPEMSRAARESEQKLFGYTKVRFHRTYLEFQKTFKALRESGDKDKLRILKKYKTKLDKIVCVAVFSKYYEEIMVQSTMLHELSVQLHLELEFLELARERDMDKAFNAKKA